MFNLLAAVIGVAAFSAMITPLPQQTLVTDP
jgi:hypothetical protein